MKTLSLLVLAALLSAPCRAFDEKVLERHVRETVNLPSTVKVEFGKPRASAVPGFDEVDIQLSLGGRTQSELMLISKDGRYYTLGRLNDVTVLPSAERVKLMDLQGSPVRGKAAAPVTVVQYTDFQCPFCQKAYEIMRDRIMKDFPGKVRWVYKSMPLGFHDWAEPAAVAAECVKLQGQDKFWTMHDKLFDNQRELRADNIDAKALEYAKAAGAKEKAYLACIEKKQALPAVKRDLEEALKLGINGTPAFVINGRRVDGADAEGLSRAVEEQIRQSRG
ncbi:MAG: thioredoxin domain-containing protein [Elusimicrobiota bacterium]|jgi:protein-disulfide isomerase